MLCISKYCVLKNRILSVDGVEIFNQKKTKMSDSDFLLAVYRNFEINYPKFFKMDNLSKTGFIAAEFLLKDTSLYGTEPKTDTALFFANKNSSLQTDENFQATIGEEYFPSPSLFVYTLPNIVMGEICIRHKIYGENTFFVSDEFNAGHVYNFVNQSFLSTEIKNAVTGWVDFYDGTAEALLLLVERDKQGKPFTINELNKLKS
jgi:hypothetical protein